MRRLLSIRPAIVDVLLLASVFAYGVLVTIAGERSLSAARPLPAHTPVCCYDQRSFAP